MSTPTTTPDIDAVLDTGYGMHQTEPRQKAPLSRSMQFSDDFAAPEVPPALQDTPPATPPVAPVPPPTPEVPPVVTAPPTPAPEAPPAPPVPTGPSKVEQVIDLGDGSGAQKFVGEGPDEVSAYRDLTAKLTKAQENATRKIRQLSERQRAKPDRELSIKPVQFAPRQITEADLIALKEMWEKNPVEAWMKLHEICYGGVQPETMVDGLNKTQTLNLKRDADESSVEFLANHDDDYEASEKNSRKIHEFLLGCTRPVENETEKLIDCKRCGKRHEAQLPVTANNLEYAFQELTAQGYNFAPAQPPPAPVIVPTPAPVPVAQVPPPPAPAPTQVLREVPPPPVVVSDRSGQRPAEPTAGLEGVNVAELNRMPVHEMKARIGQLLKGQPGTGR